MIQLETGGTLAELSARLAEGTVTSRELAERAIAMAGDVARQGPVAFVELDEESVQRDADHADALRTGEQGVGPLTGIPIAIKDLFDVAGQDTRAGSRDAVTVAARKDAGAVRRLREAGMVPFGRTNMTEFAYSGLGLNPHHGTPYTPWLRDAGHIAGGSTSGGAVAVAEGIVPAALGSDTGGSCRIPAAFCGLVGFKPTAARVPRDGMVPLSTSLDAVGWLAHTVECCIALDAVLADDCGPIHCKPLPETHFVVPSNIVFDDADPAIVSAFERFCSRLREAGATVSFEELESINAIAGMNARGGFTAAESFAWHRAVPAQRQQRYDPRVLTRIQRGAELSAADYVDLLAARRQLILAFEAEVSGFDAVMFPTVPILPPRLADLSQDEAFNRTNLLALRNSTIVNMVDGCAVNLPLVGAGGPAGFTLAGAHGCDSRILGLARTVAHI